LNKKISIVIGIIGTLLPVFFAWILGVIKLPDDVYYIDYITNSGLVLDTQQELTSNIKVNIENEQIRKLSTYNILFINDSGKHFDKVKIEFKIIKNQETNLLSSSIKGPSDYSESSMRLVEKRDNIVVYEFDYIDRADNSEQNYYTLSLLFAGDPPQDIKPISTVKGLKLRPKSDNPKDTIYIGLIIVSSIFLYILLIYVSVKLGDRKTKKKEELYMLKLKEKLLTVKSLDEEQAENLVSEIVEIRREAYRSRGFLENYIKRIAKEP
jgi:hypothetical protein